MVDTSVVKYDITEAAISEMSSQFMGLVITDIESKEQFVAVHDARMIVKNHRVAIEKRRKELKADALEFGRRVDSEAKRIFSKLEPIETHLQNEENKVLEAEKRKKEEEDRKERERVQTRVDALAKFGVNISFFDAAKLSDDEFKAIEGKAMAEHQAEQERLENERKEREAEAKRLADERAELEKLRKEQAAREAEIKAQQEAERKRLEAERKAIEAEKARIAHEEAMKKAVEEARIKAEADARAKAEREAQEAKEKAEREETERKRQEALKPDKEKLAAWANSILDIIAPELQSEEAQRIASSVLSEIYRIARELHERVKSL